MIEQFEPGAQEGLLRSMRFYDESFEGTYPDGQIELRLYVKDADSLDAWLQSHSASRSAPEKADVYYRDVSNEKSLTVKDRPAISFDWQAGEIGTIHTVAFFSGTRVASMDWFADASEYASTIAPIFQTMLGSYED